VGEKKGVKEFLFFVFWRGPFVKYGR